MSAENQQRGKLSPGARRRLRIVEREWGNAIRLNIAKNLITPSGQHFFPLNEIRVRLLMEESPGFRGEGSFEFTDFALIALVFALPDSVLEQISSAGHFHAGAYLAAEQIPFDRVESIAQELVGHLLREATRIQFPIPVAADSVVHAERPERAGAENRGSVPVQEFFAHGVTALRIWAANAVLGQRRVWAVPSISSRLRDSAMGAP